VRPQLQRHDDDNDDNDDGGDGGDGNGGSYDFQMLPK
jgi:hypothetical protein